MRTRSLAVLAVFALAGCGTGVDAPAQAQAELAADTGQARLWRAAGATALPADLSTTDSDAVRTAVRTMVASPTTQVTQAPFPESVTGAVVLQELPELDAAFSGSATVQSAGGEFLALDLGGGQLIRLHAKVRGGPLTAQVGEQAQLYLRRGDPFARNDILALRLPADELVHALVGNNGPVRFTIPTRELTVAQTGSVEGNTMPVTVSMGSEAHTLRPGEQADFRTGLTVQVVASVAVQGEAANALPGRPYRVEILGWRTAADRR